jgi:outer membrane protein OmpA-like peptidoglycan-associated protein
MKLLNLNKMKSHRIRSTQNLILTSVFIFAFVSSVFNSKLYAQDEQFTRPSWWFGVAGAANFNFYRGSTQNLNADFTAPVAFHDGSSVSLYLAPLVEYHPFGSSLGINLQVGYDNRSSSFEQVTTPCNCPADLETNLTYLSVEPSLRFAPFNSNFYLFGGPRFAFNMAKSFTYHLGVNPDFPDQLTTPDINGDFSNIKKTLISMQIGAGYDIPISSQNHPMQFVFSPFVSFQPYFRQSPRSSETWNITTLRVGAALKFGVGHRILASADRENILPNVAFSVNAPKNIPTSRKVREIFPLRNYIFFDLGSTDIPNRYELLTKDQVKDFKEDQLDLFAPKNLSGRSNRQMIVYYNVLNILGDRLGKNPSAQINLVGSSEKGIEDGKAMAQSVRNYLSTVFGIADSRMTIEGRSKPKLPSEQPNSTLDLDLLREGDRRVSIESTAPSLLMEFQGGPNANLKPVEIIALQEAPLDSYVTFNVKGANEAFTSWYLESRDETGKLQTFGPYNKEQITMPGIYIMGKRPEGNYKFTMIGRTKDRATIKRDALAHMVLWTPVKLQEGMRFSVIFEFDESKAITIYEKYLTEIVAPKIPKGGNVIIHGYTDNIGDETYNLNLSLARAQEVKSILSKSLANSGRSDVTFEVYGFGEDTNLSPFDNRFPEERFYNRTVIIDIIPNN